MKVDGAISSLIQGVSQQPARERLPGQCTLQENFSSDPVNGLTRRAPIEFISDLFSDADDYMFQDYDGGALGQFVIAHKEEDIKVFDLDGTEYTVTVASGAETYLPSGNLELIGIEDKIYVVNPEVTVAMEATTRTYVEEGSLVYLLGANYGRTYSVTVNWRNAASPGTPFTQTFSTSTPDGSSAADVLALSTTAIATALETAFNANGTLTALFSITRVADHLYIKEDAAVDVTTFSVETADGDGGQNMIGVTGSVKDAGKLPRYAPQGYVIKIEESGQADADDWYVEYVIAPDDVGNVPAVGAGFGTEGVWAECVAPDVEFEFDVATMPHILEKTGPTTFTFSQGEWEDRRVGDDTTNPLPSFVGKTIVDVGAFQGRLVFLSDVNIIMSRTNKPLDFFNQSATTLNDDDPIDVSSALGTFLLKKLVAHNRDLVIFSDKAQFIIFGRNTLTPKNTALVLTTEFEADLRARPTGAGRNVFFTFKYGGFTGVQEFFTEDGQDANNSRPITQHVLQYITGTPEQMVSTTNFNKLIIRTATDRSKVFVYEYIWLNQEKVQTSWSTWTFPRDLKHAFFVDNLLYVVTQDGNDYSLYTLNLDSTDDTGVPYRVMLDEKILATNVDFTFDVDYAIDDIDEFVAVQGDGCPYPGMRARIGSYAAPTVTLLDDMEGGDVYFGRRFTSRYIPTPPMVKDQDNVKVGSGTLIIKHYVVHFDNTGYLRALITDQYGYAASVEYSGRVIGSPDNLVGEPSVSDGDFRVPFKKNPDKADIEIQSDSHLPLSMLEIEWEGQWTKKGRRITGG